MADNELAVPDDNPLAAPSVGFNFGNIRPLGASTGFNSYATPLGGIAAMSANLAAYATQHGINTLNGLTARWAPKGDGANDPVAYAKSLGARLGIDPEAEINLADPLLQVRLIPAMATIEKGRPFGQPAGVLTAGIQQGLSGKSPAPAAVPPQQVQVAQAPAVAPAVGPDAPTINPLSSLAAMQQMTPMQRLMAYRQLASLFAPPQKQQQQQVAPGQLVGGVDASIPLRV